MFPPLPMFVACSISAVVAYLLGSIPFGLILLRLFRGVDVRQTGSGNIGAANVARVSPRLGALTLMLDAAKGFAGVTAAKIITAHWRNLSARECFIVLGISAFAATAGHVFSVWLHFRGGKGVATGMGAFLALLPGTALLAVGVFIFVFVLFRYSSLASITAAVLAPIIAFLLGESGSTALLPFLCAISLLLLLMHHENIRRLFSGTERRFTFKHSSGEAQ